MIPIPADPNEILVKWYHHYNQIFVWEDPNEVIQWQLRWEVLDRDQKVVWSHHESLNSSTDAFARVAVITYTIENDLRLVQTDLGIHSDRRAFDELVNHVLKFATADRLSTSLFHHVRR